MTWENIVKSGIGWTYNKSDYEYSLATDPETGNQIFYNGAGEVTVWDTGNKETTTWTEGDKETTTWTLEDKT